MKYYYEVMLDEQYDTRLLVKAKDVIEAGKKAEVHLLKECWHPLCITIQSIRRTNITDVII